MFTIFKYALTIFVSAIFIFVTLQSLPGDLAQISLGVNATDESIEAWRAATGLDRPLIIRFFDWITGFISGDLGYSYSYAAPVNEVIGQRALISIPLAFLSFGISFFGGLFLALLMISKRKYQFIPRAISELAIALPNFWLAIALVGIFSLHFAILPSGGFPGWSEEGAWRYLILPAIALATPQMGIFARLLASSLSDEMAKDYVFFQRILGGGRREILFHSSLKNALVSILPILGLQFSYLVAGGIIVENVLYVPGIGQLIVKTVGARDLITLQSLLLILVTLIIAVGLLFEILHHMLDKRL